MDERHRLWGCEATARSTGVRCRRWRLSFISRVVCYGHASTRFEAEQARRSRLRRAA